jgi:hypothetical protein
MTELLLEIVVVLLTKTLLDVMDESVLELALEKP